MPGPTRQLNFNMEKIKQNKEIIIAVAVILGFIFYWVQIRSASIKKECSWFTEIIPADEGVTKEQADINKKAFGEKCDTTKNVGPFRGISGVTRNQCRDIIERPAQPEKEDVREATKSEYDTCLRHNGL